MRARRRPSALLTLLLAAGCVDCLAQDLRTLADRLPPVVPLPATAPPRSTDVIDPALRSLMTQPGVKSIGSDADPGIPVALFAAPEADVSLLERAIATAGGTVTNRAEKIVLARLQAPQIERLAATSSVYYIASTTHGLPVAGGLQRLAGRCPVGRGEGAHQTGLTGRNVKVGVLDFGFQNYSKLVAAKRMPEPKSAKAWNKEKNFELGTSHGTACAEIVHTMAPDAELYLAAMGGDASSLDQFANAAQWLADQGVQIISFSGGTH